MDEQVFQLSPGSISWLEEALMVNQNSSTAFVRYTNKPFPDEGLPRNDSPKNANNQMIEFLKKMGRVALPLPTQQSLKHRIEERMRRQKHNQNYAALHKLLPLGTKGDKNSILEMAAKQIKKLQRYEEELRRKEMEMEMEMEIKLAAKNENESAEAAEIKLRVVNPASGVGSMLEVLKCLKNTATTATAIRSTFSEQEFAAAFTVETKVKAAEVEKAVQRSLFYAETKFRNQL